MLQDPVIQQIEQQIEQKIEELVTPVAVSQGLELVAIEYRREPVGWVLRFYIDALGGVTVGDCSRFSEEVSTLLDVEEVLPHRYHLEVSSPGLERPLKKRGDFDRHKGSLVRVKTRESIGGARNFKGELLLVEDFGIKIQVEGRGDTRIPWKSIVKAHRLES
ncbi:MAG: ribosome maturation factor RimP [Deltaproteobacteria bacterium]|nr:ribosome maturation factor RimP [Deltaproteobacteria bacterium]